MAIDIDFFPHGGEHCENDERQANLVVMLLAIFSVLVVFAIVYVLRVQ